MQTGLQLGYSTQIGRLFSKSSGIIENLNFCSQIEMLGYRSLTTRYLCEGKKIFKHIALIIESFMLLLTCSWI